MAYIVQVHFDNGSRPAMNTCRELAEAEHSFKVAVGCDGVQRVEILSAEGVVQEWDKPQEEV